MSPAGRDSELLRTIFEVTQDIILVHPFDADGNPGAFLLTNEAASRRLGYSREEFQKLTPSEERIPVEIQTRITEFEGRETAISTARDISERKRSRETLRANDVLYRSIFSVLNEGLIVQGKDDKILAANEAAARILGLSRAQLMGKSSYDPEWRALREDGTPFSPEEHPSVVSARTFDYVTKPFKVDELLITVQRALEFRRALYENQQLKAQLDFRHGLSDIIAESADMRKICTMIERVAPTDQTVLIGGESGVGKEVIAKAIHANSIRKQQTFVPINCAALPEPLLESELFGHVKGAFTGAATDKEGLFEVASGGTIFLDEIGSMPLSLQSKLLRVLQEKEIRRVGGTREIKVDPRVIAATNDDLEKKILEGKFREDLYYRLSVIPLHISPLRDRTEDVIPLAHFFMRSISEKAGVPMPELSPEVQILLETYQWPGNVRELENAIRHGCTFAQNGVLMADDLPARVVTGSKIKSINSEGTVGSTQEFRGRSLKGFLREMEKKFIMDTISDHHGDKEAAAGSLKVSLATLYRKLPDAE